jgi:hypothetical protein
MSRPLGWRDPPMPLPDPINRSSNGPGSTLGSPQHRPSRGLTTADILSQALAPFQSFTRTSPRDNRDPEGSRLPRPFRGFFPSSVCQPRGATYLRRFPPRRLRCALRVSHPLDALLPSWPSGLVPSRYRSWGFTLRGLAPRTVPYALSDAAPLGVSSRPKRRDRPARDSHTTRSPTTGLVIKPGSRAGCPLGLSRSEVSCSQQ